MTLEEKKVELIERCNQQRDLLVADTAALQENMYWVDKAYNLTLKVADVARQATWVGPILGIGMGVFVAFSASSGGAAAGSWMGRVSSGIAWVSRIKSFIQGVKMAGAAYSQYKNFPQGSSLDLGPSVYPVVPSKDGS